MPSKRSSLLVAALASAAVALPAQAAEATTYCVGQPGYVCPAGSYSYGAELQLALGAAQGTATADTVVIGPGTYPSPPDGWHVDGDHPLTIKGSAGTVLDGATRNGTAPALVARGATVEKLAIKLAPVVGKAAISTRGGTVRQVTITGSGPQAHGIISEGGSIDQAVVKLDGHSTTAVSVQNAWLATTVRRSELSANQSVVAWGGTTRVSRSKLTGGASANRGAMTVTDTRIWLRDGAEGLGAWCTDTGSASLTANHVTVVGGSDTIGAVSQCGAGAKTSTVTLRNSILKTATGLVRREENAGRADLIANWNNLPAGPAAWVSTGGSTGKLTMSGNFFGDPKLHSLKTLVLAPGSGLLDKATPTLSTEPLDAGGRPRPVDGDGDGVAKADIGAMERQLP